jgi:hypothetical protein
VLLRGGGGGFGGRHFAVARYGALIGPAAGHTGYLDDYRRTGAALSRLEPV